MRTILALPVRLEPLHEAVHADVDGVRPTVTPAGPLAVLHPPGSGEVGALSTVEASVEPRVVAAGECYHDFSFVLDNLVVWNAVLPQN